MAVADPSRRRNGTATRTAVLDAAEALFAVRGYRATTLHAIGAAAGCSRGTPGYIFGSKRALYEAVVDRILDRADVHLRPAEGSGSANGATVEALLAELVSRYFALLAAEPNFVRLVQFESTEHAHEATRRILAGFASPLVDAGLEREEAAHIAIAISTLCSFPRVAAASALDVDLGRRGALERYQAFVTRLLLAAAPSHRR